MSFDPKAMRKNLRLLDLKADAEWTDVDQAYERLLDIWRIDRFENDKSLQKKAKQKVEELTLAYGELQMHWKGWLNARNDHLSGSPESFAVTYGSSGFPHRHHSPGSVNRNQSTYSTAIKRTLLLLLLVLSAVIIYAVHKGLISLDNLRLPDFSASRSRDSFQSSSKKPGSSKGVYRAISPLEK